MMTTSNQKIISTIFIVGLLIIIYAIYSLMIKETSLSNYRDIKFQAKKSLPSETFEEVSTKWAALDHLIIVPGHAIQWCTERGLDIMNHSCWYLFDYQKHQVPLFIEHIKMGVSLAHEASNSLLVFSGGKTRIGMGPRSEGQSYFAIAEHLSLLEGPLYDRSVTEEYARDSLENLIFSMARFRQITGALPKRVTVVGFPSKERRFIELHRRAANIAYDDFHYCPVKLVGFDQDRIIDPAYEDFQEDLYGCGQRLKGKRDIRNPYRQQHGYRESCPELRTILSMCDSPWFQ